MISVKIYTTFVLTVLLTQQTEQRNFDEDVQDIYLRNENTDPVEYENVDRDKAFIDALDDKNKIKMSKVKVSVNGNLVYNSGDNIRYKPTTKKPKTTTQKLKTYRTTRKTTRKPKYKPTEPIEEPAEEPTVRTTRKPRTTRTYYIRKTTKARTTKKVTKWVNCNPDCTGLFCRKCRPCITASGKQCKRWSWSSLWDNIVGHRVDNNKDSLCKQCQEGSFLFGDGLQIKGLQESVCESACEQKICEDSDGNKYDCGGDETITKVVEGSNGEVSISVNSFFDTYTKLRDAVGDPNALPEDFHF